MDTVNQSIIQHAQQCTYTLFSHILNQHNPLSLQAEQYKKAAIISSSGDSQAADLLSKAFSSAGDGLIELRRLEAAEEIANTLSRSRNVAYLPGGGQNLLLSIPPQTSAVNTQWLNLIGNHYFVDLQC